MLCALTRDRKERANKSANERKARILGVRFGDALAEKRDDWEIGEKLDD